jgi:Tol biopolymer transport system component
MQVAWRRVVAIAAMLLATASPLRAQYFGQNRVQYKTFDFQVLKTEHFDIYFYPEEREGIEVAARLAERWHARLTRLLDHNLRGRQPLVLYASHTDFEQNNIVPEATGEGTGGVTEPIRRRIVLPLGGPLADTDHVIGHELVHAFQYDMTSGPDDPPGRSGLERLPLWFVEGMAEYLSSGASDSNTAMWIRDAARRETLPAIHELDNPKYFPYRWGQAFWAYVAGRWGDAVIPQMLAAGGGSGDIDATIKTVLGVTEKQLSADWQAAIRREYGQTDNVTTPSATGRMVISTAGAGQDLNVAPAISPDGKLLAFISSRDILSIDLYVADAATGRILHKLTSTATDPHYSSLQFIYSAGAWDSSSTRLAAATITAGRPALVVFDAASGERTGEFVVPGVDEVLTPTWAPDGHAIAFTGMSAGLTDLYIFDLTTRAVRRLTHDAFADMQPAWSPDGGRIAFATDRFTSRLETLSIGPTRLAVVDVTTGRIEPVGPFDGGKMIDPQWSSDGRTLFFVSDRDGTPNVYRVAIDGSAPRQLTSVITGVSGITSESPALSVATGQAVAVFTVYDDGKYGIHALEVSQQAGIEPREAREAILPPADRRESDVQALLADPVFGLPMPQSHEVAPYRARLRLENVGQPVVAVGASRFGAALGGGVAFAFSDMLNNHYLLTSLQLNSITGGFSAKDIGAEAAYINSTRRWNWGLVGGQMPYLSGGFQSGLTSVNGAIVGVEQSIIYRQTERSMSGMTAYPFSRAQRVEFQAGVTQVSFDQVVQTTTFDPVTGSVLDDRRTESSLGPRLTLGTASAAFVSDTSQFGATSPVAGQRYRLEVDPTFGSVSYAGVLADYRRYVMPVPFYTLAGRLVHYGRYGGGAEDPRLTSLYLGYPTWIRGYDVNSFSDADCVADATSACPAFDRLIGSRMLVGNVEFRFPMLRPFGVSQRMYGPVPVEVAFFGDAGVAWGANERPSVLGGAKHGVSSAGVALRVNLLGYAVGEFDFVRPFQRPGTGWEFQFNLAPGF